MRVLRARSVAKSMTLSWAKVPVPAESSRQTATPHICRHWSVFPGGRRSSSLRPTGPLSLLVQQLLDRLHCHCRRVWVWSPRQPVPTRDKGFRGWRTASINFNGAPMSIGSTSGLFSIISWPGRSLVASLLIEAVSDIPVKPSWYSRPI